MDAKLTVRKGIFFCWIFFERFAEISSSFFVVLSLLPVGFSSVGSPAFPILVPFDVGTDETAQTSTQVLELQGTFSSRLSGWTTSAILFRTRLP
jgi:hypothetical protein